MALSSDSFKAQRRPAGKEFRSGVMGEAINDLYSDVDAGFLAVESSAMVVIKQAIADAAGDTELAAPFNLTVLGGHIIKTGGNGAAGDTIKVVGTGGDITNAADLEENENTIVQFSSLDLAEADFDSGENITFTAAKAGNCACTVVLTCIRR